MLPIVAVTADQSEPSESIAPNEDGRIRPTRAKVHVSSELVSHLRKSGVEVIVLPPGPKDPEKTAAWVLAHCSALVITGGHFDIHPAEYGQTVQARIDRLDLGRTSLELALARAAIQADFPVLGICGGMQALAVAGGGTLIQDIRTQVEQSMEHEQQTDPSEPWHPITIKPGLIHKAYGCSLLRVNSTHHQAVDDPGCFVATAHAPDGVIEAIEHPALRCCVGVQWHPEYIDAAPLRMIAWFASNLDK